MQEKNHLNAIGIILFDKKWNVLCYVKMLTNQNSLKLWNERWSAFEDCKLFNYLSIVYFNCVAHKFKLNGFMIGDNSFIGAILWKEQQNKIIAYIQWVADTTNNNVSDILKAKRLVHTPPKHIAYRKPKNLIPLTYNNKLYFQWSLRSNSNYIINVDLNNKNTRNGSILGEYAYYNNISNVTYSYEYHQNTGFIHLKDINEYLGIGHIHYNFYENFKINKHRITWGSHYSHFFFAINDKPPFNLKRISSEFCFVSLFTENNNNKSNDCDVIQFAGGMIESRINNIDYIFISYG
eukprot:497525_1